MLTGVTVLLALCAMAATGNNDIYVLIDEISVYNCRGVKNEIRITEDDVNIINEYGKKAYYIRAPGNYSLHFKNIKVEKKFGYLAGEIGVTLQVPIIEGTAGMHFDIPYTVIPEQTIFSSQCDENSGVIERNGRQYCRYCDLCQVGKQVEKELSSGGHQFLPGTPKTDTKGATCGNIDVDNYEFKRTISLPDRSALENLIKGKVQGIDDEIKKRLNKGRGRFQVFLNLISAEKPSLTQSQWFSTTKDCNCDGLSSIYCDIEACKSQWALQCLHNTARIAACNTVEFNYRMTTNYADVLQFLRENKFPNQDIAPVPQIKTSPVKSASGGSISDQCVKAMPARLTHLKRYCTIFWNAKLCCAQCDGIC